MNRVLGLILTDGTLFPQLRASVARLAELGIAVKVVVCSPQTVSGTASSMRRDGAAVLLVAEGGTGYNHAVTVARSRRIEGPYEIAPNTPLLSARHDPSLALQKAGHASLVETQSRHYGSLIRKPYGEPFWTPETVEVDDVVGLGVQSM